MERLRDAAALLRRAAARLRRGRLDEELREEIAQHIEERRRQLVEAGLDPREAAYEARRLFGNPVALREETRDLWSFRGMDTLAQDARFGTRLLLRTPLVSAIAILSLALGIGAAVAVFTVADAVLFRPLPVRDPAGLRAFQIDLRLGGAVKSTNGVPETSLADLQNGADFADFVGFRVADEVSLEQPGGTSRITRVEFASANYFDVLGIPALAGRLPESGEQRLSPTPVVISERLWRTAFEADPRIAGRTIALNGHPSMIVGVVRQFTGLVPDRPADVFAPLETVSSIDPTLANFVVMLVARLRPGVTPPVAEQKLAALYRVAMPGPAKVADIVASLPDASRGVSGARAALERPLWLGLALVSILVVVACANTGALILARFVSRQTEFGVRAAIGAGRWRLGRQLTLEALLVSGAAGALALTAGWLAAPLLMRAMPETGSQVAFELRFDTRLTAFTAALAGLCAAAVAAASLFRLWRSDPLLLLNGDNRSIAAGSRRITRALVAVQIACSLLLVVGAVSMARTLANLRGVDIGFDPARTFIINVNATGLTDPATMSVYHGRLHERLAALPGVAGATMAQLGILARGQTVGSVQVPGFSPSSDEDRISRVFFVGPGYFDTLGMRIIAGRDLSPPDGVGRRRATVVNERFAQFYFGSVAAALDRTINGDVRIVGVVADAHYNTPRDEPPRAMFVPYGPLQRPAMAHIVRASGGDMAATIRAAQEAVKAHDPRLRPRIATADELMTLSLARERFFASIASTLSGLALLLACAGLHAAVAYAISQRRGELAVRLALGASSRDLLSAVLREPVATTIAGLSLGVPGAYIVMRSAASLLYGVSPFDLPTIALCAALLSGAGLLAAAWPARRALAIDPVEALRSR
jgi:predicted permease